MSSIPRVEKHQEVRLVIRSIATALLGILLSACTGVLQGATWTPPSLPESVDSRLVQASDQFGISLLKSVYAAKPGENLFLSPTSASVILSLTANGARGETQQEMLTSLGYAQMPLTEVNEATRALQGLLANPDPKVELSIANAIWYQKGFEVVPSFHTVATQQYGARIAETTFGQPEAAAAINRWVSDQTRGRIPKLLDETRPDDRMVLVNAIYFKGAWTEPFNKDRTHDRTFYKLDGSEKQVPFMHKTDTYSYLRQEGLTGVRLPYGKSGDLNLYVFMPDQWDGFMESLTPEQYQEWITTMGQQRIQLALPKVKLTCQAELANPLTELGMGRVFDPNRADFSGIFTNSEQLYISRVIQKTFLEINEEGTEAAAATGVIMVGTAAPTAAPPEVVLDHPFLLAIRDDRTGVTLFMGAVLEP